MVTILPDAWVADRPTGWDIQLNASVFGKAPADCLDQILRLFFWLAYRRLQDLACFLFHRAAMASGADAKLALGVLFQLSNCDASHTSMIALMSMIARAVAFPVPKRTVILSEAKVLLSNL
jgi:MFS-type transporter involved in bile tolerance (Atg22 family)